MASEAVRDAIGDRVEKLEEDHAARVKAVEAARQATEGARSERDQADWDKDETSEKREGAIVHGKRR